LHVDLEHMGKERLRDVHREATEEDGQHDYPLEVFVD
jgi:hypothetical protein